MVGACATTTLVDQEEEAEFVVAHSVMVGGATDSVDQEAGNETIRVLTLELDSDGSTNCRPPPVGPDDHGGVDTAVRVPDAVRDLRPGTRDDLDAGDAPLHRCSGLNANVRARKAKRKSDFDKALKG